jgi:PKD repeat protein
MEIKLKKFLALACAAATFIITGCDDDKTIGLPPAPTTPSFDVSIKSRTGNFEVIQEKTLTLVGIVNSSTAIPSSTVYSWTVDGVVQASSDTVFNFVNPSAGDYAVTFTATNEFGTNVAAATVKVLGKYSNGVFVLNEGALGHENGSLIHIDEDGNITENVDVYVNGKELGITSQHMFIGNKKIYIVSKSTDSEHLRRVVVLDAETLKEVADYTNDLNAANLSPCDNIGALENEIFLTAQDGLYSFNTQTKAVTKIKNGTVTMMRMHAAKGKLFAVNGQYVKVFEEGKDTISTQIKFDATIRSVAHSGDGNLYVALANEIHKLNVNDYSIMATSALSTGTVAAGGGWMSANQSISAKGDTIYFYSSTSSPINIYQHIFSENKTNLIANVSPFLPYTMNYGGVAISPKTGNVYVSTIGSYGAYNSQNAITVIKFEKGAAPGANAIKHVEDYIGYTRFAAGIYLPECYE